MHQKGVRVRFAPSPTGPLHIGGARSVLFNYLFAKKHGGTLILRIEDTDLERSSKKSEENIKDALKWLGLTWDEGVDVGGPYLPYRQTERLSIYQQYTEKLLDSNQAYECFCTEEELEEQREVCRKKGELPRYLNRCRDLSREEKKELAKTRKSVVRFRVPQGQIIQVNDLVRGNVRFESDGIGDFVIVKSDGLPTYNYAVVVDDATMGITHVIRGEEHLPNTSRQVLLYEALGFSQPLFAHVSLILGKDRSKMSKRDGDTSVEQYREKGYLPDAIINFLALLGWSPDTEEEIFTSEQLIELFSLERVSKSPAVFDMEKLNWLNGFYIRNKPLDEIASLATPYLQAAGFVKEDLGSDDYELIKAVVNATRKYLTHLSETPKYAAVFFNDDFEIDPEALPILEQEQVLAVLGLLKEKTKGSLQIEQEDVKQMLKEICNELALKGKEVFMPIRVALTGMTKGPEMYDLIPILGGKRIATRIDNSLKKLAARKD
jgi:nondiscriminating glutamyl-tRNA synthetase